MPSSRRTANINKGRVTAEPNVNNVFDKPVKLISGQSPANRLTGKRRCPNPETLAIELSTR